MRTGQIGLIGTPTNFAERLICWATGSKYFHTVLAVTEDWAVSAEPGGARLRPIDAWPDTVWSDFPITNAQRAKIVQRGHSYINRPYNWLNDLSIGVGLVLGWETPKFIREYLWSEESLECAQLCDAAYDHAGYHIFNDGRLPGAVWPGSFEKIYRKNGWL